MCRYSTQNMEIGISTLFNKLTDKKASCCLCYKHELEKMCSVQDTVVFSVNFNDKCSRQDEEFDIYYILQQILGDKVAAYISEYDPICDKCTRSAISSYKFIKMCRENTGSMANSLDILTSNLEHAEEEDTQDHKSFFLCLNLKKSKYTHYYDTEQFENSSVALYKFQTLFRPFRTVINCKGITKYKCTKCPRTFIKSMNARKHFNLTHKKQLDPYFVGEIKNGLVDSDEINSAHDMSSTAPVREWNDLNSRDNVTVDSDEINSAHDMSSTAPVREWNDLNSRDNVTVDSDEINSAHDMSSTAPVREWNDLNSRDNVTVDSDEINSAHDMSSTSPVPDWNALYNRDNLKRLNELSHEVITASDGVNKYKCRGCGALYVSEASARRHFKKNHILKSEIKNTDSTKVKRKNRVQNNKSKMKRSIPAYMKEFNYCRDKNKRLNELSHTTITDSDGNIKYKCKECESVFLNSGYARKHYLTSHVDDMKIEEECYIEREEIKTGLTNKSTKKNVSCIYCNQCYGNKYILIEHLLKQHGAQNSDTSSDKSIKDIPILNKQIYQHIYTLVRDENGGDKYCCKICLKIFIYYSRLRNHFNISHLKSQQDEENHYICSQCGKEFKNKYKLNRHEVYTHSNLACGVCKKGFKTKSTFNDHVCLNTTARSRKKKNICDSPFICDTCGKSYRTKDKIRKHIKDYHMSSTGPKKYPCPLCAKMLSSTHALKGHQLTHTGEKNFSCDICGDVFGSQNAVKYHTRIHTGETPYPCSYCDMKFLSASRRSDHVNRHHIAAMGRCPDCGVTMKQAGIRKHKSKSCKAKLRKVDASKLLCK